MKTGRIRLSDEEKKRRGTFDERYSEAASVERAQQKVVSLFGGEVLSEIPAPPDGLSKIAQDEYWKWTRMLHTAGRLSELWLAKIQTYAISRHSIVSKLAEGKMPPDGALRRCDVFLKELGALNVDQPQIGSDVGSKWKKFGAAQRIAGRR
ncbi:MAG: hypothetical protein ACRCWF_18960 [Beijerinckiaceae bacterium]